ncbi:hypothetical protein PCANC_12975 [Puccinia coronata f. sp. avenae]|uniref:Uncharacterized protein n=1 Tax=Puccinia coronata f. sp. avenae TaxID=200324 RepID=A0A2N5UNB2_9BASI|nr:hypothetical protein PCANC_12975 [Puccinia coronata f. sp. avenae]PLW39254.1 hypothetical protein PCASD_05344 [Puccinia coronata f. sp. avenae]
MLLGIALRYLTDECIPSISKPIARNYKSEQVALAGVIHDISRRVEASRSVLTDLISTDGRQMEYDLTTLAQLTSGEKRIAPRGLFLGLDDPIRDFFSLASSRLSDFVSAVRTAVRQEKDMLKDSCVSSSLPATSSPTEPSSVKTRTLSTVVNKKANSSGRPIAVSTIPLTQNGSKPAFRFKRDVLNSARDPISHLIAVSTLPLRTSRGLRSTYRERRKILSFSTAGDSFHTLLSRAGTPLAVSSIPVAKTEEEEEQAPKAVVSPESAKASLHESLLAAKKLKQASTIALIEEAASIKNQSRHFDYTAFVAGLLKPYLSPSK